MIGDIRDERKIEWEYLRVEKGYRENITKHLMNSILKDTETFPQKYVKINLDKSFLFPFSCKSSFHFLSCNSDGTRNATTPI